MFPADSPFLTTRIQDTNIQPGSPTWGPTMCVEQARKHEATLLDGGDTGLGFDRRADARQAAWDASPFAASVTRLFANRGSQQV